MAINKRLIVSKQEVNLELDRAIESTGVKIAIQSNEIEISQAGFTSILFTKNTDGTYTKSVSYDPNTP